MKKCSFRRNRIFRLLVRHNGEQKIVEGLLLRAGTGKFRVVGNLTGGWMLRDWTGPYRDVALLLVDAPGRAG